MKNLDCHFKEEVQNINYKIIDYIEDVYPNCNMSKITSLLTSLIQSSYEYGFEKSKVQSLNLIDKHLVKKR